MATRTWDGGAATQNWEDANNWSDNTVPVTGDTAIIPTGMGVISGTPSADVLAQVTVQGDSALNVTLASTDFTFEDSSSSFGTLTGDCVFSGYSSANNNNITGDCEFSGAGSYNNVTVAGNCVFSGDLSYNGGTVDGNAIFSGVAATNNGTITGDADFQWSGIYYDYANPFGTVSGTVTISGDVVCEYNSSNASFSGDTTAYVITGSLSFLFSGSSSYNDGKIVANCEFSGAFSYNNDDVVGNCIFSGSHSSNLLNITGDCTFSGDQSFNDGIISGACIFSGSGSLSFFLG